MLENYIFDSSAYRTLKPGPRALLWEIIRRFNGSNNGQIGLGVREAAKSLSVSKDTASSYFLTLIEHGFIRSTHPGGFNMKDPSSRRATEWRLTWKPTDSITPTKDFLAFEVKSTVRKFSRSGPKKSASCIGAHRAGPKN